MELMKQRLEKEMSYIIDHMDESAPNEVHYESLTRSLKNVCDVWLCFKSVQNAYQAGEVALPETEEVVSNVVEFPTASNVQTEEEPVAEETIEEEVVTEQETPTQVVEEVAKPVHDKDDLRDVLGRCSIANHNIKDLLAAFGANKLSAVQEKDYDALYEMASKLLGE